MKDEQLILGIDPGSLSVGYGLVSFRSGKAACGEYGVFKTDGSRSFPARLKDIFDSVSDLISGSGPDAAAVEAPFVNVNAKTSLILGHARGVILLAAAIKEVPVAEYAPREIKQSVVGNGAASKSQVQWMVRQILGIREPSIPEDASDALAAALCHGYRQRSLKIRLPEGRA
jgi:crossover junction endodeoxyribonuclease RuvC